jgi:hypothetical protein
MADVVFPTLTSPNWKLTRTPQWSSIAQTSAAGRRYRAALRSRPLWKWTLKNGVLQADPTIADLQAIEDFFNARGGTADSFLWQDPEDTTIGDPSVQVLNAGVYYWRVAFLADALDFERFAGHLWKLGSVSFSEVTT